MTELPPPAPDTEALNDDTPTDKGRSHVGMVLLAIGVAILLIVGLASFGINAILRSMPLAPQTSQTPQSAIPETEVPPTPTVIVLTAKDAQGNILSSASMKVARDVVADRLDRAGVAYEKIAYSGENVSVVLEVGADPAVVMNAVEVVRSAYRLDFRRVVAFQDCSEFSVTVGEDDEGGIVACERDGITGYVLGPVELDGERVIDVEASELSDDEWSVNLLFDDEGARTLSVITAEISAVEGAGSHFAMVLDGEVLSAPRVGSAITDGNPQITGWFSQTAAEALSDELRLASQGLNFTVESVTTAD